MRNMIKFLLASAIGLTSLSACDVIHGPKVDPTGFTGSTNKVLVEDITGHQCGNCPRAHEQAKLLKDTYGENIVIVAVHAGGFARVAPLLGFGYDFNTTMGTEIESHFQADATTGLPIGLVNRRLWGSSALAPYASWGTHVGTVLAEDPKMKIDVTSSYNPTNRNVTVGVKLEYFTTGDAAHQLVAIITEDSIIAKQEDYILPAQAVDNYVHNHVLRGAVTPGGTWGTAVKGNNIVLGEKFNLSYTAALGSSWVPEHCHVVVFVHNNNTKQILQVQEVDLVQ